MILDYTKKLNAINPKRRRAIKITALSILISLGVAGGTYAIVNNSNKNIKEMQANYIEENKASFFEYKHDELAIRKGRESFLAGELEFNKERLQEDKEVPLQTSIGWELFEKYFWKGYNLEFAYERGKIAFNEARKEGKSIDAQAVAEEFAKGMLFPNIIISEFSDLVFTEQEIVESFVAGVNAAEKEANEQKEPEESKPPKTELGVSVASTNAVGTKNYEAYFNQTINGLNCVGKMIIKNGEWVGAEISFGNNVYSMDVEKGAEANQWIPVSSSIAIRKNNENIPVASTTGSTINFESVFNEIFSETNFKVTKKDTPKTNTGNRIKE